MKLNFVCLSSRKYRCNDVYFPHNRVLPEGKKGAEGKGLKTGSITGITRSCMVEE